MVLTALVCAHPMHVWWKVAEGAWIYRRLHAQITSGSPIIGENITGPSQCIARNKDGIEEETTSWARMAVTMEEGNVLSDIQQKQWCLFDWTVSAHTTQAWQG